MDKESYTIRPKFSKRNLTVVAKHPNDGRYYRGIVTAEGCGNATRKVKFVDQTTAELPLEEIISFGGAVPWPDLNLNDRVLTSKTNRKGSEYVPGRLIGYYTDPFANTSKIFSIKIGANRLVERHRKQIVKIGGPMSEKHTPGRKGSLKRSKTVSAKSYPRQNKGVDVSVQTEEFNNMKVAVQTISPMKTDKQTQTDNTAADLCKVPSNKELDTGLEVLARFPDDGWFYFGMVVSKVKGQKGCYLIKDGTGHQTCIHRDDIIVVEEEDFQPSDYVVALHPDYIYSYAPGILQTSFPSEAVVEFYDNKKSQMSRKEIYKISQQKYTETVELINDCAKKLADCAAIVLERGEGHYKCKKVKSAVGSQHLIVSTEWEGITQQDYQELAVHIFPMKDQFYIQQDQGLQYVLAPTDQTYKTYLPAEVEEDGELTNSEHTRTSGPDGQDLLCLKFCDGTRLERVEKGRCYYLSEYYYRFAVQAYKDANTKNRADLSGTSLPLRLDVTESHGHLVACPNHDRKFLMACHNKKV